ncbi:hypothetical protein C8R44DRAFT_642545, partial [Mycena epipterygia]
AEAEKYDKALVENWKSDMDDSLKAGLFSASLTVFLIESHKTVNLDSGDVTVQLLSQISQQLAASTNGTTFHSATFPLHSVGVVARLQCIVVPQSRPELSCALVISPPPPGRPLL